MEGIGGRLKRFTRLLTEVSGTLAICALIDTGYDGVNGSQYEERVKHTTKPHYQQAQSMIKEYETLFQRIQQNMDEHVDQLTRGGSKTAGSSVDHAASMRPYDTFIQDILPDLLPDDEQQHLDLGLQEMFHEEMENAKFVEKFRTVPSREEVILTTFTTGMQRNASRKTPSAASKSPEDEKISTPTEPAKTGSSSSSSFSFFHAFNLSKSSPMSGTQELLTILDCIAEKQQKLQALNQKFDHNFSLLMRDVDCKVQERMSPNEATNEGMIKSIAKMVTSALFLSVSKRFIFPNTSYDFVPAASLRGKPMLLLINLFLSIVTIPACVGIHTKIGNILTNRPVTTPLVEWIKEDEEGLSEEDQEFMDEEAVRLIEMLMEEAPNAQVWQGASRGDPFRVERMIIYDFMQPLTEIIIFYNFLLKNLRSFIPTIPAHLITMLSYAMYRDTIEDPHRGFMKLPATESFLYSSLTSLLFQMQYVASGSLLFPIFTAIASNVQHTLVEAAASPRFHKESWQYYHFLIQLQTFQDHIRYQFYKFRLGRIQQSTPTLSKADGPFYPEIFDAQGKLHDQYQKLSRSVLEVFSTDYFADHSSRTMQKEDIIDFVFAFEHYRKSLVVKYPHLQSELKKPLFGFPEDVLQDFLVHPCMLSSKDKDSKEGDNTATSVSSTLSQACQLFYSQNRSEEVTCMKDLHQHVLHMVVGDNFFPKGVSIKEFEELFGFALSSLPKEILQELNVEELRSSLAYWEEVSVDQFLDLMQDLYTALLNSGVNNVPMYEPELYELFEQELAGRRPTVAELNTLFARFNFYLQIGGERTKAYFLHKHGLTQHRLAELIRKFSAQSKEVEQLKADWEQYFTSIKHRKKLMEAIPNLEKKRILYEILFTRNLRQNNPLKARRITTAASASAAGENNGGEGNDGDEPKNGPADSSSSEGKK